MRRLFGITIHALSALWILSIANPSFAEKSYQVEIQTVPAGATLFLDDESGERVGVTPYQGRLPSGDYSVFLKLDGYESTQKNFRVSKKRRRQTFTFELDEIVFGSVEIVRGEGAAAIRGATILIDGDEVGTVGRNDRDLIRRILVGPHQVEVVREGYETYEDWVEVLEGERTTVVVDLRGGDEPEDEPDLEQGTTGDNEGIEEAEEASAEDEAHAREIDDEDGPDPDAGDVDIETKAAAKEFYKPMLSVWAGLELGFRSTTYDQARTDNLVPYVANTVPVARLGIEAYPFARGHAFIRGLGVQGSFARAAPIESVDRNNQRLQTLWVEFDIALRWRLDLGRKAWVALQGGYGIQNFTFGGDPALVDKTPHVAYAYLPVGFDLGLRITPRLSTSLFFEYRILQAAGVLADRFERLASVALSGGMLIRWDISKRWHARVKLDMDRYSLAFVVKNNNPEFDARGATDVFMGAMFGGGFSF